ncbi:Copia protein, partial [Mucuna pruriens]
MVVRNKARLVAHGYSQQEGIDFTKTFALITKLEAIHILLFFASHYNGDYIKWISCEATSCFESDAFPNHVIKLKSLFMDLSKHLVIGMKNRVHFLWQMFEMSMMEELKFFLGFQIKETKDGIYIHQSKYVNELLKKFNLEDCKTMSTPMHPTSILILDEADKKCMFCVRFQDDPRESHLTIVSLILVCSIRDPNSTILKAIKEKNTSEGFHFIRLNLVSWSSKRQ